MTKAGLAPIVLLASFTLPADADPQKQKFPPLEVRSIKQYPGCPGGPGTSEPVRAIDLASPVDDALLDTAWASGVRIVIRYYDWPEVDGKDHPGQCNLGGRTGFNRRFDLKWKPGPTLPAKSLTRDELKRLQAKGFSVGPVFQHCNQKLTTFLDRKRADYDAARAMDLARALVQPKGTTIFFTADFDAAPAHLASVRRYFKTVGAVVKRHGYKIGGYANGYLCAQLKADTLISSCWLSQSTGFLGSRDYQAGRDWDLQQCATRKPFAGSDVHFDTNVVNPSQHNIGWWKPH